MQSYHSNHLVELETMQKSWAVQILIASNTVARKMTWIVNQRVRKNELKLCGCGSRRFTGMTTFIQKETAE